MGGLFSRISAKRLQKERRFEEYRRQGKLLEEKIRPTQQSVDAYNEQLRLERLRLEEQRQLQIQLDYLHEFLRQHLIVRINVAQPAPSTGYTLTLVLPFSEEYTQVQQKFQETAKRAMRVTSIHKIDNPFVKARYQLKLAEARRHYHHESVERVLYHGTVRSKLDSICRNNLDYRKCTQHKFGSGVSFSPIAYYASHYSDKGDHVDKIILVCKVIVMKMVEGDAKMIVPPIGADASCNYNGHVIVKYDDDTYYPEYIITYRFIQKVPASNVIFAQHLSNLSLHYHN